MARKPTHEELEQQVEVLQRQLLESKEAEKALQDIEERFRDLVELLPQIIFEMNKDGVLTFVNQQALKMTGYSQEDFKTGTEGIRLLIPEDRQRATGNTIDIMGGREAESHEYTAQRKDGSVFPVIAHSTAIMRDGKPSGIRGIIFDVTDQKRAEETLRQRESALEEKTNELKEVNDALRFLLRQRNRDKANMEEEVLANVRDLVIPYIEKLKQAPIDGKYGTYLKMVESNLNELVSPFAGQLSSEYFRLTPAEIQVAHLIRAGKTTKEIAGILNASHRTIESHRHNIRTKFGLKNRKANLRSCLSSL